MFVRSYLRASTNQQDAERARSQLEAFCAELGAKGFQLRAGALGILLICACPKIRPNEHLMAFGSVELVVLYLVAKVVSNANITTSFLHIRSGSDAACSN